MAVEASEFYSGPSLLSSCTPADVCYTQFLKLYDRCLGPLGTVKGLSLSGISLLHSSDVGKPALLHVGLDIDMGLMAGLFSNADKIQHCLLMVSMQPSVSLLLCAQHMQVI